MPYKTIYLKYRPQHFSDVVGQEHVVDTLVGALQAGHVGHAYLFAGPHGVGKTTLARILAKAVNCEKFEKKSSLAPCNDCEACHEITRGSFFDLLELDAASNRGIDEIRRLIEQVRHAPAKARKKVFIIDEVHMLTKEAFNALLKTLEEPPPHVLFILATTEIDRVPRTIISRTQSFQFRTLTHQEIVARLKQILEMEDRAANETALELIASTARGSIRDAESALEKILGQLPDGQALALEKARSILGLTEFKDSQQFLTHLFAEDIQQATALIKDLFAKGQRPHLFIEGILHQLRWLMLAKISPDVLAYESLTDDEKNDIIKLAKNTPYPLIRRAIDSFVRAKSDLRLYPNPLMAIELACFEVANTKQ